MSLRMVKKIKKHTHKTNKKVCMWTAAWPANNAHRGCCQLFTVCPQGCAPVDTDLHCTSTSSGVLSFYENLKMFTADVTHVCFGHGHWLHRELHISHSFASLQTVYIRNSSLYLVRITQPNGVWNTSHKNSVQLHRTLDLQWSWHSVCGDA